MRNNKGTLRQEFGLSQQEIADILMINRSQWSMFEANKANLPHKALIEFAAMLAYVHAAKTAASKKEPLALKPKEETIKKLEYALGENKHRQCLAIKKIERLQKKQAMGEIVMLLEGYFIGKPAEGYFARILDRAQTDSKLSISAEFIQLEIKLKLLQYEETILKATLEEL